MRSWRRITSTVRLARLDQADVVSAERRDLVGDPATGPIGLRIANRELGFPRTVFPVEGNVFRVQKRQIPDQVNPTDPNDPGFMFEVEFLGVLNSVVIGNLHELGDLALEGLRVEFAPL